MITCYFGLPGCGKSTLCTAIARKQLKKKKKYSNGVYTINIQVSGCKYIDWEDIKKYKYENCCILIDEITMNADNREFKTFPKEIRDYFILHRHLGVDIIYFTQNYENVDKKIRDLTAELWYMHKPIVPLISALSIANKIYRNITINEYTSELKIGYRFAEGLEKLFASNTKMILRRKWYKYFDSYDQLSLKGRLSPPEVETIPEPSSKLERILKHGRRGKNSNKDTIIKYINNINN